MKIYTYEGKANISGDRIHQARTAQRPTAPPRLYLSCAASGSPVPATKPASRPSFLPNFLFLTPLHFFRPAQGEVKKRPHTYPTFALSNPQS